MLPDNTRSSILVSAKFIEPAGWRTSPMVDYEMAGINHLDTSQGLMAKIWKCWYDDNRVKVQPEGGAVTDLFVALRITELALAFDQNMRWSVAYIQDGMLKLRWYDSQVGAHVISEFADCRNPRLTLDDKRPGATGRSDIILAYLRGNNLCYRQQRDRFGVEYTLRDDLYPYATLGDIGMTQNLRMKFELV